jgi:2-polyprenyl-3-methyl-5-hydroxy-6-metoxy-1,4-benzoquinol methylase
MISSLSAPTRCPSCAGSAFDFVEEVQVSDLARGWATVYCFGKFAPDTFASAVAKEQKVREAAISETIGSPTIRFDRCRQCGIEVSTPAKCWTSGDYPEAEQYPFRWEFNRFLDDLSSSPRTFLELGAGEGRLLKLARDRGHTGIGLDFSSRAVEVARKNGNDVILGGFDELRQHLAGRPQKTFDAIVFFHVIEHLPQPAELIARLAEFSHPGTLLAISCPGPQRFTDFIRVQQTGTRDFWDYPPHHVLRWTERSLRTILSNHNWETVTMEAEPFRLRDAAAQDAVTTAMWKGKSYSRWRMRLKIAASRIRLLPAKWTRRGVSIYCLAKYAGKQTGPR